MLLTALAFAGTLGVSAPSSVQIRVDGEVVPIIAVDRAWLQVAGDRVHVIEAESSGGKPLGTLELAVPEGLEVELEWRGRNFAVTRIAPAPARGRPGVSLPGMPSVVIVTAPPGSPAPLSAEPAVIAGPVVVELIRTDSEWANVYVDGEKLAEFRVGDTKKVFSLPPGPHVIEVRDFMDDDTRVRGVLTVTGPGPMKVGFDSKGRVETYTSPGAWKPQ